MKSSKKKLLLIIIIFLISSCIITHLLYPRNFTFVVINNTDSIIDNIKFKTSNLLEKLVPWRFRIYYDYITQIIDIT